MLTWYGLPLHIIRDVYLTLRSFITRIRDFIRYRRATAHMNSRYPDATAEEVGVEGVCIICREEMRPWSEEGAPGAGGRAAGTQDQRHRPKKLPCGHVLHFACLRSWLERQQRCPTCRRPVLDENTGTNTNARNPAGVAANGLAFQAQWGFGGLQFGMGAGAMGDLIDRMGQNQGNPQQQPQQPQQGDQQPQVQPVAQFPQPPVPQQPQPQQQPQAPAIPQAQPDLPARAAVQQRIDHTVQLIQHEAAMLQQQHRHLQELQQLQAQQNLLNTATPLSPPAAPAVPAAGPSTNPTTANAQAAPGVPNPFAPPRFPVTGSLLSPPLAAPSTPGLPQGLTLPAGWSVIPLTVFGMDGSNAAATRIPSLRNSTVLAARRGQRTYQENLRNYHALRTPTERSFRDVELGGLSGSLGVDRTFSTPASSTSRTIGLADTSRLTLEQITTLKPVEAESITALSLYLARHYSEGRLEHVSTILLGLPEEIRKEILIGWPSSREMQQIRDNITMMEQNGDTVTNSARESAIRDIGLLLLELGRADMLRVLLGLPTTFRNSIIDRTDAPDSLRLDVEHLRESLSHPAQLVPEMPEIPTLADDVTEAEVSRTDAETREVLVQRIDALNNAARRMREAAQSLEATANNSPFSVPTPRSFANGEDRLNLFGERSMFPLNAQERTLRSLESELVEREREFNARGVVEGLLNGGQNQQTEKPELELQPELEGSSSSSSTAPPSTAEKGKGVDRGSE